MLQPLVFVFIGILTMCAMEFQINVLAQGRLDHFAMAVALYAFLLIGFYFVGRVLDRKVSTRSVDVVYYFLGGLFGLLIVEWVFMGNYPGSGKGAIQTAMFALWAAVLTLPRIFTTNDSTLRALRMRMLITIVAYSAVSTLAVFLSPAPRKLPVQAILMCVYGLILNFLMVPYLSRNGFPRTTLYTFNASLALAAVLNALFYW